MAKSARGPAVLWSPRRRGPSWNAMTCDGRRATWPLPRSSRVEDGVHEALGLRGNNITIDRSTHSPTPFGPTDR